MNKKEILDQNNRIYGIVSYISIIAALICIIIYFISGKIGWTINGVDILLSLLASISIFIIANAKKTEMVHDKVNLIYDDVSVLRNASPTLLTEISNEKDFYVLLDEKVKKSSHRVWWMHLDPWEPNSPQVAEEQRQIYFNNMLQYIKLNPRIVYKRIISIPDNAKLAWVEKLINDTSEYNNLELAYINIDCIEKFGTKSVMTVISCQIIDNDKMFLLNPLLNYVPEATGTFKKCLYFENKEIVSIYQEYYSKLWDTITSGGNLHGCLLKSGVGSKRFYDNIDRIKKDIADRECEKSKESDFQNNGYSMFNQQPTNDAINA
nr:hypothetical protein [uncultured Methanolobus sp.]